MENTTATACEERVAVKSDVIPVVTKLDELLQLGIVSHIPITSEEIDTPAWKKWAAELSIVSPIIMTAEGDGEYAFYRNILEEPDFPFDSILRNASIKTALTQYFNIQNLTEIKLDDAFCIHYNMSQKDTSGAKHIDPSDITINLCLDKSDDCRGSQVLFYGTKTLHDIDDSFTRMSGPPEKFLVNQEMGFATMHWGDHPHETTTLEAGYRTNIILTYCYTDKTRSNVSKRSCYNV